MGRAVRAALFLDFVSFPRLLVWDFCLQISACLNHKPACRQAGSHVIILISREERNFTFFNEEEEMGCPDFHPNDFLIKNIAALKKCEELGAPINDEDAEFLAEFGTHIDQCSKCQDRLLLAMQEWEEEGGEIVRKICEK